MAKTIVSNGHTIEVKAIGMERIYYDGREVSSKISMFGSTHVFSVQENEQPVQYEVKMSTRWWGGIKIEVRRNGMIIYTD